MLDTETRRRIDTARDILVGKVPDPKSQVDQITIALIYKFMWDIDAQSEELGGERSFFVGEFDRYGWPRLMHAGLGGHATLNLYAEALDRIPENPGIPPLFRTIFNNAYLPYHDPETLRAFLKVIDEFEYDHSERLGDAFEYLLSVMGAQGDAGQFRTPRHIIDFIVAVIDPKKHETVLDPACGTAGFLISSYKHILAANRDEHGQSTLTPDERGRLADNFMGYDISPDMVRLSLVNMYLHDFADPRIHEYDTLTNDERWSHHADVILANPPFMSPKGGIRPHNRFSITSKRSEVLFVDYMAEHLTPAGRAGIIVPEGIIFQSQRAHTRLRQMLVEDSLVAVVSLPAGVFKPYSGVKTSILILDRTLARCTDRIAFFKVTNDGFELGDQRRPIDTNDLPQVQAELADYRRHVRVGDPLDDFRPSLGFVVSKERVSADREYNLGDQRYREVPKRNTKYPYVPLKDIAKIASGSPAPQNKKYFEDGTFPFIRTSDVGAVHRSAGFINSTDRVNQKAVEELRLKLFPASTILFPKSGASTFLNHRVVISDAAYVSGYLACITCNEEEVLPKFVYYLLCHVDARKITPDQAYPSLTLKEIGSIDIPLPSLAVQQYIVAEIEGYQKVVDGARAVIDNYHPHIPIDPEWPAVELGEVINLSSGQGLTQAQMKSGPFPVYGGNGRSGCHSEYFVEGPTIAIGRVGAYCGAVHITEPRAWVTDNSLYVKSYRREVDQDFLAQLLTQLNLNQFAKIGGQPSISQGTVYRCKIALPKIEIQKACVAQIRGEQSLVKANGELIDRFGSKIQTAIGRVWDG